jgi:hypothetical protein
MGPGIWAASDPERPVDWVDLLVLDIPFPMPVVDPGDASERVARMCEAGIGRTAANAPAMVAALMRLPPERRRCIVAQTYQTCVEAVRNRFMASADPPPTKEERYALDVAVGAARSGTIAACRFPLAPEEVALADQWADLPIPSPRMSH